MAHVKRYIDTAFGQIHAIENRPVDNTTPLYCLHATAYSGQTFEPLIDAFRSRRRLVALDTPGYGSSARPAEPLTLEQYAEVIGEAIRMSEETQVDLLGYHTGAFLATELAVQRPELIRRLILIGIPYFTGEARAERLRTLAKSHTLGESLAQFEERWDFFITQRAPGQSVERGFANFVDELRAWPHGWWAHRAAFTYEPTPRLRRLEQAVLVLNPRNHLSQASADAAHLMPNATVIDMPHLSHAIFDLAAEELAEVMLQFLEQPLGERRLESTIGL